MVRKKQTNGNIKIQIGNSQRLPPHSEEIEQIVLGSMIVSMDAANKAFEILPNEEVFYIPAHRHIFRAIQNIYQNNTTIDLYLVIEELERLGTLNNIGGRSYIIEISQKFVSATTVETHCKILIEKYMLRSLIGLSNIILSKSYDESEDVFDIIDEAEKGIFDIAEYKFKKTYIPLNKAIDKVLNYLSSDLKNEIKSGYIEFDKLTGGFHKSDLTIIAARPGVGKTAFALSLARNIAGQPYQISETEQMNSTPVGFFSLEMTTDQIILRLIASEARMNLSELRKRSIKSANYPNEFSIAVRKLFQLPIYIDDTPALSLIELRAKARRMVLEQGVKIIFVDYLQLMSGPATAETREREIAYISRGLKALAKELDIPVVALAQLNRQVEGRADKRPILSDLRESGAIEQDADVVCFIHRPDIFARKKDDNKESIEENIAEIIVAKQRNGPTGDFKLVYLKEFTRFENYTDHYVSTFERARGEEDFPTVTEPEF